MCMTVMQDQDDLADAFAYRAGRPDPVHDVIVVGGGVAGLAAALWLSRARRDVLVLDAGHPRNRPATHTHGFLTRDGAHPLQLLRDGRAEIRSYGNEILAASVTAVSRDAAGGFTVRTADAATWRSRRLLMATGVTDQLPTIPGVREQWGRDVVHCPYCFGWEIRDQPIGVLGTRQGAYEQALMWRQWSADILMFRHAAPEPTAEQAARLAARGIPIIGGEVEALEITGDNLTGIRLADGNTIPRRVLVVPSTLAVDGAAFTTLGIDVLEHELGIGTHVPHTADGRTTVPGVWVCGNAADPMSGALQSAASGAQAGAAINADLTEETTLRALAPEQDRRPEGSLSPGLPRR